MKKLLLTSALICFISSASALEIGINTGYSYAGADRATYGVSVGDKVGAIGLAATYDRATKTNNDQNRYGVIASYDVAKVAGATVAVKSGVAYLNNQDGTNGFAGSVGAGVSYPLFKDVALTADYRYQAGQKRVESFNGNTLTAGVKFSF